MNANPDEGTEYCEVCSRPGRYVEADVITIDFDRLCSDCARELHAEVSTLLT